MILVLNRRRSYIFFFAYDENTGDFVIVWGHMGAASINYFKWENDNLKSSGSYDFNIDEIRFTKLVLEEKGINDIWTSYMLSKMYP